MKAQKMLNTKCAECNMCHLVDETITGSRIPIDQQYYQCLADQEGECVDSIMIEVKKVKTWSRFLSEKGFLLRNHIR